MDHKQRLIIIKQIDASLVQVVNLVERLQANLEMAPGCESDALPVRGTGSLASKDKAGDIVDAAIRQDARERMKTSSIPIPGRAAPVHVPVDDMEPGKAYLDCSKPEPLECAGDADRYRAGGRESVMDRLIASGLRLDFQPGKPPRFTSGITLRGRGPRMRCRTCRSYVPKSQYDKLDTKRPGALGRCRRRAPTLNGWPAVFESDWCGDHKLDERKADAVKCSGAGSRSPA